MDIKVNIFPNEDEESGVAAFWAFFSHHEESDPLVEEFTLKIAGYIPVSDSVIELRKAALEKAKAILSRVVQNT